MRTASRCKKRSSCWWSDFSLCSKGGSCDAAPVSGVPASRSTSVLPRKIYSRKLTQPHGFMSQRHAPPRGLRNALRLPRPWLTPWLPAGDRIRYLVDPASSHMLVSKTKPCKYKYKQFIRRNCRWLIKTVSVYAVDKITWIPVVIPELIHARRPNARTVVFIR